MSISYWQNSFYAQNSKSLEYDIVIIGAGIAGLSTAYWIEKTQPQLKIALIDKQFIAAGASGKNAGFVTCGSAEHFHKLQQQFGLDKAVEIWKFSETNRQLVGQEIIQNNSSEVDYFQTGSATVCPRPSEWERYLTIEKTMKTAGIDVELVTPDLLQKNYGVKNAVGAIQYLHDGIIHPVKLLNQIQKKLKRTDFYFNEEVFNIAETHNQVQIQTRSHSFQAGKVFAGLNGFVSELFPELKNLVKPQRGQVVVTEKLPPFVKGPCYLTEHLCYFRQLPTGELLVGGFRNQDLEAENTAFDSISEKIQQALTQFTQSYFNNTQTVKINYRWSGVMGFTPDGQMLIGQIPSSKNIYTMAGCSGHGMGLSFHAAKVMVENALSNTPVPSHLNIQRQQAPAAH